jgi:hypothetical protein
MCLFISMTKQILFVALALVTDSAVSLASGIADMSGTTFTQQLHQGSPGMSLMPAFLMSLLALGVVLAVRSQRLRRDGIPASERQEKSRI